MFIIYKITNFIDNLFAKSKLANIMFNILINTAY